MSEFYEICKILTFDTMQYHGGDPFICVRTAEHYTQENTASVEFDYQRVYDMEDQFHNVVGFYHTHPSGMNYMSQIDMETMSQWSKCLGKSLLCVIETKEKLNAWVALRDGGDVVFKEVEIFGRKNYYQVFFDRKHMLDPIGQLMGQILEEDNESD